MADGRVLEEYAACISVYGAAWGETEAEAFARTYSRFVVIYKRFEALLKPVSAHGNYNSPRIDLLCSALVGGMDYNLMRSAGEVGMSCSPSAALQFAALVTGDIFYLVLGPVPSQ